MVYKFLWADGQLKLAGSHKNMLKVSGNSISGEYNESDFHGPAFDQLKVTWENGIVPTQAELRYMIQNELSRTSRLAMYKIAADVEDTEPQGAGVGFLHDPHKALYPNLFQGQEKIPDAVREALKNHVLEPLKQEFTDPDKFIYFTIYGSGISYNWDESGDLDLQLWIDIEKYSATVDDPLPIDDLLADVRRVVQTVNFPSFVELGLVAPEDTDEDTSGGMLIQYYPKPGKGSKDENLASNPYACYDLETDEWLVHPKPIEPQFYGDNFLLLMPKAKDIALQAEALLGEFNRNVLNWQFWFQMYNKYQKPEYREQYREAMEDATQEKAGIKNLFQGVFGGRAEAYLPGGKGIEDERDMIQKLLEVWGVFQELKHFARVPLPWDEQEMPDPVEAKWKLASFPEIVELNSVTDPNHGGRRPFIYDEPNNRVFVGTEGSNHRALLYSIQTQDDLDIDLLDNADKMGVIEGGYIFAYRRHLLPHEVMHALKKKFNMPDAYSKWVVAMPSEDFVDFFDQASRGEYAPEHYLNPIFQDPKHQQFYDTYKQHAGNFDQHIETSIPGYRELQVRKGAALVGAFPGETLLDIGGSEGSWAKTITTLGGQRTVNVEPNEAMAQQHQKNPVPGAEIVPQAFLQGFEYGGTAYPQYQPNEKFDIINESMTFQFIDNNRGAQIAEAKRLLAPGGLFLTDEKVITSDWAQNEAEKDQWKAQFYTPEQQEQKQQVVNYNDEESAVGMVSNMSTHENLEAVLNLNFTNVIQYWSSGNFVGYACSDNPRTLATFINAYNNAPKMSRTAAWSDIMNKAQRLIGINGVQVQLNTQNHVIGQVKSGVDDKTPDPSKPPYYTTEIWRDDPNSGAITLWACDCQWGSHSWGRTRIWKKYEGRPCTHTLALYWTSLKVPVVDEGQQTIPGFEPQPGQPTGPPPNSPVTDQQSPLNLPNALQQTIQQETEPAPSTKAPAQISQPQPAKDTEQMTIGFPGALSRWRKEGMFENGDYVRANERVDGYDDRGTYYVVPRNMIGEVLWSDPEDTIVIFSIEAGPLGPQNVKVTAPTDSFTRVPRERGTAPRRH